MVQSYQKMKNFLTFKLFEILCYLLALLLIAGLGFFVAEYVMNAADWVMFPGSPHVYSGGNIGCGVVVDRDGTQLLDMNDGRVYADSAKLRKATVHWLGDRYGNISLIHVGSIDSAKVFTDTFQFFTAEDYQQTFGKYLEELEEKKKKEK